MLCLCFKISFLLRYYFLHFTRLWFLVQFCFISALYLHACLTCQNVLVLRHQCKIYSCLSAIVVFASWMHYIFTLLWYNWTLIHKCTMPSWLLDIAKCTCTMHYVFMGTRTDVWFHPLWMNLKVKSQFCFLFMPHISAFE